MKRHWQNERRLDYRAGIVAALLYNAHRDPKKGKALEWSEFFAPDPFHDPNAKVIEQGRRLRAWLESRGIAQGSN